jgi:serine/threonine protein kinase
MRPGTAVPKTTMKFGQYELLDRIAVGGMAEVFRGRTVGEEGFEKPVAIKRILPSFVQDGRFVSMLVNEARIHAALSHRNIVQIHDLGISEEGEYFIVLEYVDGPDLASLLSRLAHVGGSRGRPSRLPDPIALFIAIEIGEGVHFAHQLAGPDGQPLGLVHRDISPSNVLLSYAGEVKLSDFGLAKRRTDQSVVGSLKGKLAYMSPEQARRVPIDGRSDIFALGAVMFEMLTGHPLREIAEEVTGWQQVASGLVPSARRHRPDIPAALERLLDGALAPDRRDRFPDAGAFVAAARAALELLPRSRAGEAGELHGLLKDLLPPGSPRPRGMQSKVIRLASEFLAAAGAAGAGSHSVLGRLADSRPPASTTAVTTVGPPPLRDYAAAPAAARAGASDPWRVDSGSEDVTRVAPPPGPENRPLSAQRRTPSASEHSAVDFGPSSQVSGAGPSAGSSASPLPRSWDPMPAASRRPTPARPLPLSPEGMVTRGRGLRFGGPGPGQELDPFRPGPRRKADRAPRLGLLRPLPLMVAVALTAATMALHYLFVPLPVLAVWVKPARLDVRSDPSGAEVYLDGRRLPSVTPTYTEVKRDRRVHALELRKEGFRPARKSVRFDRATTLLVAVPLEASVRPSVEPLSPRTVAPDGAPGAGPDATPAGKPNRRR